MTVTHEETDIDWFTALDFEHDIACDNQRDNCSNKAEWAVRTNCCGSLYMICDPCKIMSENYKRDWPDNILPCLICQKPMKAAEFYGEFVKI